MSKLARWVRVVAVLAVAALVVIALAAGAWLLTAPDLGPPALRRGDGWSIVGPGGGGTFGVPVISPHDPRVVLTASDMSGVYVTTDGGDSWQMRNLGGVVSSFAFDPRDPRVVYAGNAAILRTDDVGRTWRRVLPDPARSTVHLRGDHAEPFFVVRDEDAAVYPSWRVEPRVSALAVSSRDGAVYAALGPIDERPRVTRILVSRDGGHTWARSTELDAPRVIALEVAPRANDDASDRVLAITDRGVHVRTTASTWALHASPNRLYFGSIGFASGRALVYATTRDRARNVPANGGVLVSEDEGRTWRRPLDVIARLGLRPAHHDAFVGPIASARERGRTAYVAIGNLVPGDGSEGRVQTIARTDDAGHTWRLVHREAEEDWFALPHPWRHARGAMEQPHEGIDPPDAIAVSPRNADIVVVTDPARLYQSIDGGRTWAQRNSRIVGRAREDRWTSRGLDVTTSYDVVVDPFEPSRILVATTDIGLQRSEDDGASWTRSTTGIPDAWRNTAYAIAFDPDVPGLVWGAFSGTHDLPRPKMWREAPVETYRGGVAISHDGGRTWRVEATGLPEAAITHVLVDPSSPRDRRTLFATAFGHGVFRSDDGGATWTRTSTGISERQPFTWRLARARDGTLYVVVARRSMRGRIGDGDDGALYRSMDRGSRWSRIALPAGTNGPMGVSVDPHDSRRLALAAWGREVLDAPTGDTGGGVFVSSDAGRTWRPTLARAQHVYDVTRDPRRPDVLYACGFDGAAFRSVDRGERWTALAGYDFAWGHRVVPDPVDARRVYITTFGGGVWHGEAR